MRAFVPVAARERCRVGVDLAGEHCSVLRQRLRHRQRAVAREGPDLQNPPRAHGEGHHLEEGGLQGAHYHLGTVLGAVGLLADQPTDFRLGHGVRGRVLLDASEQSVAGREERVEVLGLREFQDFVDAGFHGVEF